MAPNEKPFCRAASLNRQPHIGLPSTIAAIQLSKILRLEQTPLVSINLSVDDQRQINFLVTLIKRLHAQAQREGHPVTVEDVLDQILEWEKQYQKKDLESLKPIVMKSLSDGSFGAPQDSHLGGLLLP